tara:strand:+ start:115 stop:1848 length:1734 start_codon:yes stop_codon:yes gene_type:complete
MATQTIDYNINVNAGGSLRTIQDIENELNELNQEIKDVGVGSSAFKTAAGNIQQLEKELAATNATVEGFTLEKKLDIADGGIKVLAGSVAGLTGAIGLMGIESEEFDKLTAQASNAIAFSMGIKDISEGVGKLTKNLKFGAIAQKAYNLVQRAFNAIMSANPVAIVILSITTLIGLVIGLKDKFEAVNKVFEFFKGLVMAVGEALGLTESEEEKQARLQKERYEQRILDIDNELKIRKAAGEDTVELEREKYAKLLELAEKGSQEERDIIADQAAFEAGIIKEKQDAVDKAAEDARKKRLEQKEKDDAAALEAKEKAAEEAETKKEEDAQTELDRLQSIKDVVDEFELANEDAAVESELERLELEQERKLQELTDLGAELEDKKAVELFYANLIKDEEKKIGDEKVVNDKAILDARRMAQMEYVDAIGGVIGALGGLAKQGTAAAKASAIAGIVISTGLGFAKGLTIAQEGAAATGPAAPFAFPIFYATQIAAVLSSIGKAKSILSQVPGGGGGGGGVQAPQSIANPTIPSIEGLNTGVSPETAVGGTAVQAYVVSGDITSSQEAEAKLSTRRAIGG